MQLGKNNKMKKITIFLLTLILSIVIFIVLLFLLVNKYQDYSRHRIAQNCMMATEENLIGVCLEYNGFFDIKNIIASIQLKYDFHKRNYAYNFKNRVINDNFVNSYGTAMSECKNVKGCYLKDDGKGYYIALNKCLIKNNCIEILIYDDRKDCLSFFDYQIEQIPKSYKNFITVDKNRVCKIKKELVQEREKIIGKIK